MELLNEVQSKRCGTSDEREKAWQEYKKYGLDNEDNKQLAREAFNAGWDACMKVKHEI